MLMDLKVKSKEEKRLRVKQEIGCQVRLMLSLLNHEEEKFEKQLLNLKERLRDNMVKELRTYIKLRGDRFELRGNN